MRAPKNQSLLLPIPSNDRAPRTVRLTVTHADHIRAASDARFPPSTPPARALHAALDDAEATRLVLIDLEPEEALTMQHVTVPGSAPDAVHAAHRHVKQQLRKAQITEDTGRFRVEVCVRQARIIHAHHLCSRSIASRIIRSCFERAELPSLTLYADLPWDAALVVDTLATLDPNNDALQAAARTA